MRNIVQHRLGESSLVPVLRSYAVACANKILNKVKEANI